MSVVPVDVPEPPDVFEAVELDAVCEAFDPALLLELLVLLERDDAELELARELSLPDLLELLSEALLFDGPRDRSLSFHELRSGDTDAVTGSVSKDARGVHRSPVAARTAWNSSAR